jgi:hypothetical protein
MEDDATLLLSSIDAELKKLKDEGKSVDEARVLVAAKLKPKVKSIVAEEDDLLKEVDKMLAGKRDLNDADRSKIAKQIKLETEGDDVFDTLKEVKDKVDKDEKTLLI